MPLLKKKKKKKKQTRNNNQGLGRGEGEAVWTVTPPMNEYMGVSMRKMSIPTQLDQEFENIWKKKKLHHYEQCLGLGTLENQ